MGCRRIRHQLQRLTVGGFGLLGLILAFEIGAVPKQLASLIARRTLLMLFRNGLHLFRGRVALAFLLQCHAEPVLRPLVIRPNRERAAEGIDRGMRIAIRFQRQAQIAPGDGIIRHELRCKLEFLERVFLVSASPQRYTQALMRRSESWLDRDGLPELRRSFFRLPLLSECDAIVIARFGVLRPRRKALAELRDGVCRQRILQIGPAQRALDRSIAGTQLVGSPKLSQRFLDVGPAQKNRAQVVVRRRILGIQFQHLPIKLDRFIPAPGFGGLERLRPIVARRFGRLRAIESRRRPGKIAPRSTEEQA